MNEKTSTPQDELTPEQLLEAVKNEKLQNVLCIYTTESGHIELKCTNMPIERIVFLVHILDHWCSNRLSSLSEKA